MECLAAAPSSCYEPLILSSRCMPPRVSHCTGLARHRNLSRLSIHRSYECHVPWVAHAALIEKRTVEGEPDKTRFWGSPPVERDGRNGLPRISRSPSRNHAKKKWWCASCEGGCDASLPANRRRSFLSLLQAWNIPSHLFHLWRMPVSHPSGRCMLSDHQV